MPLVVEFCTYYRFVNIFGQVWQYLPKNKAQSNGKKFKKGETPNKIVVKKMSQST